MPASDARVPVTLLTGFLGSGKTTLLRQLLSDPGMSRTAVVINEFGEIGLDHLLVRSVHGNAIVLQNGCICCTLQPDLQKGLRDVIDSRAAGSFPDFDRLVIESTGLADPAPILQTLILDQMLKHAVRLANTIATIDAVFGAGQLRTHVESIRQAAIADRLVITKSDLVTRAALAGLQRDLAALNPTAQVVDRNSTGFSANTLLIDGLANPASRLAEVRHWVRLPKHAAHGHDNEHDHHERIQSFSLRIEEAVDWTAFGVWLTSLLHSHGRQVLRVKGLLNVTDALGPIVLHGVQHVIHPPLHLDVWPDDDTASRLVFVVQDLSPDLIRRSLFSFLVAARSGTPVSRPTASASIAGSASA